MPQEPTEKISVRNRDHEIPIEVYSSLPRHPVTVVLENLRSKFNVGAIFRTCECARVEKVFTCGYTAHPPDEQVLKTAMGTCEFVPHEHLDDSAEAVKRMREAEIPIFALETTSGSRSIYEVSFPARVCLVVGNEALGVSSRVLEAADTIVEIPMHGYKNSLNVASALSITLFEVLHQWGAAPGR
ncbi:MAG: RNA methyltransferase [Gemmatimonadota bacterium]|nr:RNA methyltransferase [Gemmatimonadota bacterium]